LFGHVRGAFTGAAQTRTGLLSLADGGTVFLDELAEVPLAVQVKLLRVLEHGEVLPVGASQPQRVHLRILAATHLEHAARVARGAPLRPEHFPPPFAEPMGATPAEQVAAAVRRWVADRVRAAGGQPPVELYADLLRLVEPPLLEEVMRRLQGNRWV